MQGRAVLGCFFCNFDTRCPSGNPIWQPYGPTPVDLVHLQEDGSLAGRMTGGRLDQHKIGAHMRDADGFTVENQLHFHLGGMRTVSLFCDHE